MSRIDRDDEGRLCLDGEPTNFGESKLPFVPTPDDLARSAVLAEIRHERNYQTDKWGNEFDDKNTVNDFTAYITKYAGNAAFATCTADQRTQLVKVAALAVAAIETIDRNGKLADRHYDS